jgi:hypothetical protein
MGRDVAALFRSELAEKLMTLKDERAVYNSGLIANDKNA